MENQFWISIIVFGLLSLWSLALTVLAVHQAREAEAVRQWNKNVRNDLINAWAKFDVLSDRISLAEKLIGANKAVREAIRQHVAESEAMGLVPLSKTKSEIENVFKSRAGESIGDYVRRFANDGEPGTVGTFNGIRLKWHANANVLRARYWESWQAKG